MKLFAPWLTPERLYLQEKRWRDWTFWEQKIQRIIENPKLGE